jgi:hypothetical protein
MSKPLCAGMWPVSALRHLQTKMVQSWGQVYLKGRGYRNWKYAKVPCRDFIQQNELFPEDS